MTARRIVITSMGMISPVGKNTTENWDSLLAGKSGIGPITQFDASEQSCRIAGEIDNFNPSSIVPEKDLKRYDRYSLVALAAAQEAWDNLNLDDGVYDAKRMGVILGVGIGGLSSLEENHKKLVNSGPRRISPFVIPLMISNLAPGHIAIRFGLKGINYTVTSACTFRNSCNRRSLSIN